MSGAAPSRRVLTAGPSPARASWTRARSISSTNAATCAARPSSLKIPFAQTASGIERRFEHAAAVLTRHFERDRLDAGAGSGRLVHRLFLSRSWIVRIGSARRIVSSKSPRISEAS